ncbi:MAG TPA: hypothetical protein VMK05_03515 [Burkholderiales bacterium]|nr:hypothetical protein [Burkholderiales bacterium]
MPIRRVEYKDMVLRAAAFEVAGSGRYLPILTIGRLDPSDGRSSARIFDPPCPSELFADAGEAIDAAIEFGRAIVDGNVPGLRAQEQ